MYSTDFVGCLKLVDVSSGTALEVINTHQLGYEVYQSSPITLMLADWIDE
ncbi:MAG: hypothetical protein JXA25_12465 [Anaerolineales bacterium]|nr:hypothetical protein [Anaerolineales bacterium]